MKIINVPKLVLPFCVIICIALNSNAQLSGNYTIGGTNPDFPTIDSAIAALRVQNVIDTVTFNIRPGYYSGTHSFYNFFFHGGYPVTFRGQSKDAKDVIFACDLITDNYFTLKHVTLLPRVNTTFYAPKKGLEVRGYQLRIDSCIIQGPTNMANYNNGLWLRAYNGIAVTGVMLTNLTFKHLDYGLVFSGVDYWGNDRYWGTYEISNSVFDSCGTAIYHEADIEDSLAIAHNEITNCDFGIQLYGNDVGRTYIQANNFVSTPKFAIHVDQVKPTTYRVEIFNNFLSGGYLLYDLYNSKKIFKRVSLYVDNSSGIDIFNNSFNGGIRFKDCSDVHIYNNNFCTFKNTPVSLYGVNSITGSHNNFYADSSGFLASFNGFLSTGIPYFMGDTGFSSRPFYFSQTDLHSYSPLTQHLADPNYAPGLDIDGEIRNSAPDIGADEYQASDLFPFAWFEAVCVDDTLGRFFNNLSVRADSVRWDFGDGSFSNQFNPSHTYTNYGSFLCVLTISNIHGQSTYSDTIVLTQRAPEQIQVNGEIISISNAYHYYQWYLDDQPIKGANNNSYKAKVSGIYKVLYRDEDNCNRYASTPMWVGIGRNDRESYIASYPNPVENEITIVGLETGKGDIILKIYNVLGHVVRTEKLSNEEKITLQVFDLKPGIYVLELGESLHKNRIQIIKQ